LSFCVLYRHVSIVAYCVKVVKSMEFDYDAGDANLVFIILVSSKDMTLNFWSHLFYSFQ